MYIGTKNIGDYLTFSCTVHDPSSGAAIDADAEPTYRIYENETATPIATGTLSKLDDANTVGFYTERIQILAATGFEDDKSYTIYISAAVASNTDTTTRVFDIVPGAGANAKIITFQYYRTASTTPIPGIEVIVKDATQSYTVQTGITDVNGQVQMALNAATYKVIALKAQVNLTAIETLVVTADATQIYYGDVLSPTAPDAGLQTLYGNVALLNLSKVNNQNVIAEPLEPHLVGGYLLKKAQVSVVTDSSGYFEISVVRGSKLKVKIDTWSATITITTDSTRNLSEYIDDLNAES